MVNNGSLVCKEMWHSQPVCMDGLHVSGAIFADDPPIGRSFSKSPINGTPH